METSAKDGTAVHDAFEMLINEVYRILKKNGEIEQSMNTSDPTGIYKTGKRGLSRQSYGSGAPQNSSTAEGADAPSISDGDPLKASKLLPDKGGVQLKASLHST